MSLTKDIKHLCTENYKISVKETDKGHSNGKMVPVHGLEKLILLYL